MIKFLRILAIVNIGALGMENGDVLRSVNGLDITSPENALDAYARLRSAEHLDVRVRRGRSDIVIHYDLD